MVRESKEKRMTKQETILNILAENDGITSTDLVKKIRRAGFRVSGGPVDFEEMMEDMGFTKADHGAHGGGRKITWTV